MRRTYNGQIHKNRKSYIDYQGLKEKGSYYLMGTKFLLKMVKKF